jgi:hypothetical protein
METYEQKLTAVEEMEKYINLPSSIYVGVTKYHSKWRANMSLRDGTEVIGHFDTEEDARDAHDYCASFVKGRIVNQSKHETTFLSFFLYALCVCVCFQSHRKIILSMIILFC